MDKETAIAVQQHGLAAVTELTKALNASNDRCSPEVRETIRRAVGLSIGRIQVELLEIVNQAYPMLDDLK